MSDIGQRELFTQMHVVQFFRNDLNGMLRYGAKASPEAGEHKVTVWLIDWENPENNDFAIAEEVTVTGLHDKRPDIVLCVNGIALCVLELKRSTVSVAEGIRQNLDKQRKGFIRPFFAMDRGFGRKQQRCCPFVFSVVFISGCRGPAPLVRFFTLGSALQENVSLLTGTDDIEPYPYRGNFEPDWSVKIDVFAFEGIPDGPVRLDCVWALSGPGRNGEIPPISTSIVEQAGPTFDDLVSAESRAIAKLAEEIVNKPRERL